MSYGTTRVANIRALDHSSASLVMGLENRTSTITAITRAAMPTLRSGVDIADEDKEGDFNGVEVSAMQNGHARYPPSVRRPVNALTEETCPCDSIV